MTWKKQSTLEEGTIPSLANKQLCTALWKLDVIPKVRVFWWRVLHGILPDSMTLKYRHIIPMGWCDKFQAMDETLMHALVSCTHAKTIWAATKDWSDIHLMKIHPETWACDILMDQMFLDDARCKIITIMHSIWSTRNRRTHDQRWIWPSTAIKWVHETLSLLEIPGRSTQPTTSQTWRRPEAGWIKINTNGLVLDDASAGGARGVAHSHLAFLGYWCKPLPGVSDPFIA